MKYKAICFDVDGTLYPIADEIGILAKMGMFHPLLAKRYSDERNLFRSKQGQFDKLGLADKSFEEREATMLESVMNGKWSHERCLRYMKRYYRYLHRHFRTIHRQPKTVELFKRLKSRGYTVAIMSDWPLWNKLENLGVAEYCDFKCDPDSMLYLKPDVRCFEYVLYNLKMEPSEVLYVGDSYTKDVEGAVNAGMDAVLVNTEDKGQFPKALKVFKNWDDFSFWMEAN